MGSQESSAEYYTHEPAATDRSSAMATVWSRVPVSAMGLLLPDIDGTKQSCLYLGQVSVKRGDRSLDGGRDPARRSAVNTPNREELIRA